MMDDKQLEALGIVFDAADQWGDNLGLLIDDTDGQEPEARASYQEELARLDAAMSVIREILYNAKTGG